MMKLKNKISHKKIIQKKKKLQLKEWESNLKKKQRMNNFELKG
jgi:hypothetical protein